MSRLIRCGFGAWLLVVGTFVRVAGAQMPTDNDAWKARCTALSASATAIDHGSAPPELLQVMRSVGFEQVSWTPYSFGIAGLYRGVKR